jgi:hypothetical protein
MSPGGGYDVRTYERARDVALRGYTRSDPLSAPLYTEPFTAERRYTGLGRSPFESGGLYGRLRGDTITMRRRP